MPFLVRWPGMVEAGSTCDQLVHQADLMATLAGILEVRLPDDAGEDSFDLMPLFKGAKETVRSHAVSAAISGLPAVRMGPWKLIPGGGSGGWSKGGDQSQPIQLYDLSNDLGEMRNLAAYEPERVDQIQDLFEDIIIRGRSTPGQRQSNDVRVRRFPVKTRQ